ncbi:hypothetical protein L218DRAFT_945763 [Marasmius fiardii PR-910]|nr:hypothetical protein L218DRAFT_945763 [Marasmius fiardii PR-910]
MDSSSQDDFGPILDTLVYLTHDWLAGFINALKTYRTTIGLPPPHPNYPLPVEFPFGGLTEVFHWVQIFDNATQVDRSFRVRMRLIEGDASRWEPLVWTVYSGAITFGCVELDRRVFVNQSLVSVDPLFILEGLADAVQRRTKLIVSSRIVMRAATDDGQPYTNSDQGYWYELYEVRTASNELVKELGSSVLNAGCLFPTPTGTREHLRIRFVVLSTGFPTMYSYVVSSSRYLVKICDLVGSVAAFCRKMFNSVPCHFTLERCKNVGSVGCGSGDSGFSMTDAMEVERKDGAPEGPYANVRVGVELRKEKFAKEYAEYGRVLTRMGDQVVISLAVVELDKQIPFLGIV